MAEFRLKVPTAMSNILSKLGLFNNKAGGSTNKITQQRFKLQ